MSRRVILTLVLVIIIVGPPPGPARAQQSDRPVIDGVALGRSVADQILALRQNDGSGVVLPPYLGAPGPGQWRPTSPSAPGQLPQWADVTPFAMTSPDQFRPSDPPTLTSDEYTAAFNEVKELGSVTSATRTADQTATARFWASGAGTPSAIGHLNLMAQIAAEQQGNTLEENARLFAAAAMAMDDALIAVFDAKYTYNFWRPITAIRNGHDGNDATTREVGWTPFVNTPMHPEYPCAHCIVSSSLGAVLAAEIGNGPTPQLSSASDTAGGAVGSGVTRSRPTRAPRRRRGSSGRAGRPC